MARKKRVQPTQEERLAAKRRYEESQRVLQDSEALKLAEDKRSKNDCKDKSLSSDTADKVNEDSNKAISEETKTEQNDSIVVDGDKKKKAKQVSSPQSDSF
jgi:hypothetical protein